MFGGMVPGYHGKVLNVDLSSGDIRIEPLDSSRAIEYLGGRGLAVRLLCDEIDPLCDPLGPGNAMVIASSPLVGSKAPTAGLAFMAFKSPLTGFLGIANSGGAWGAGFKATGYDALIIRGAASGPVYLEISPDVVRIKPAGRLWGKTIPGTVEELKADDVPGDPWHVLCIGPAGENMVLYASVAEDGDPGYGRCGPGAVWGSKNLKAMIVRGKATTGISDQVRFAAGLDQACYLLKQAPVTKSVLRDLGSAGLVGLLNVIGMLPHRNFQDTEHKAEDLERVSGETLARTLLSEAVSCHLCPIGCRRRTRVPGKGREEKGEGPDLETAMLLGPVCGIYDLEAITEAGYRLNELGLDALSFGGTVACAMELYGRGIIGPRETGGLDLTFGKASLLEGLAVLTASRKAFGAKLADGSFRLAEGYGKPEYSMTVKKLEIPPYDPRASYAQALGYMTSPVGACHLRGGYAVPLAFFGGAKEVPRFSLLQSPLTIRNIQDAGILQDSLGVCRFTGYAFDQGPWSRMVSGVTGLDLSAEKLGEIEDRTAALERVFNMQAGLTGDDDRLPDRFAYEPIVIDGRSRTLDREVQAKMRGDYYLVRGWDARGVPAGWEAGLRKRK